MDISKKEAIIESLSPLERKILPHIDNSFDKLMEKTELDSTSVLRGLRFLESKGIIKLEVKDKEIIELGVNGVYYKKNHLPERRLIMELESGPLTLEEAQKKAKLSQNELRVSIGILKQKNIASLANGKMMITAAKEEVINKTPEEQLLEILPTESSKLSDDQLKVLDQLKKRKDIVSVEREQIITYSLTELGNSLSGIEIKNDLIEEITPEVIKTWNKQKKFRKYDIRANVPKIHSGKRHFVNQAINYGRNLWLELGFKELEGPMADSSFWVFDSLFTAQNHSVREMQDTFFIKDIKGSLPSEKLVSNVKKAHESGVDGSKGWNYSWSSEEAKKMVLRTHTTALSARALSDLKKDSLPVKYFTIGKVFRNETVDWKHGFEFYQTEGIVIDENANFSNLLGYLKLFYEKMGFEKIRFRPSFFPYTEPSVEVDVFHPERKEWIEFGGAGMLRPEVIIPLFGRYIPVLAWGQGFDRIIMDFYKIKDLREMYQNDIKQLREKKVWI